MKSRWIHNCNNGHTKIAWIDQIDCPLCAALEYNKRRKTLAHTLQSQGGMYELVNILVKRIDNHRTKIRKASRVKK